MVNSSDSYDDILCESFYPENNIQEQILWMTQKSLIDSLSIKESLWEIKEYLSKWEMPSEYLYLAWSDIYNNNCYSVNSPYHSVSVLEIKWMLQNAEKLDKHLWSTIIDIWCGNWKKPATLIKYLKSKWLWSNINKYIWLDWSFSMLQATKNNFDKAGISGVKCECSKQRFQELKMDDSWWKKTFMFMWWNLWTFSSDEEMRNFLLDVRNNMSDEDTFMSTVFVLPEQRDSQEISDAELHDLQTWFVKAEKDRYNANNLWDMEKQKDVDMMRSMGVESITIDDFDVDFFFDQESQKLIDTKIFKKDILAWGQLIFPKWFVLNSPWTSLDKFFFQPLVSEKIKDFSESIYNTNQSREFVLNFFDKYLHIDVDKLQYKAERNNSTNTMEIFVECLDDLNIYIQDDVVKKVKWDKIMIHQSHRFTNDEINDKFSEAWLEVVDDLKVWWNIKLLDKLVHEELMKIYVLKKK